MAGPSLMNLVDLFPSLTDSEIESLVECWNEHAPATAPDLTVATLPFANLNEMLAALEVKNRSGFYYNAPTEFGKLITKLNHHRDKNVLHSLGLEVEWNDP
jgi:hypothetical protein